MSCTSATIRILILLLVPCCAAQGQVIEEIAQLSPSDPGDGFGCGFGTSVAIDGDWIVIGAPLDSQGAPNAGAGDVDLEDAAEFQLAY